jgi:hypothetical protein
MDGSYRSGASFAVIGDGRRREGRFRSLGSGGYGSRRCLGCRRTAERPGTGSNLFVGVVVGGVCGFTHVGSSF